MSKLTIDINKIISQLTENFEKIIEKTNQGSKSTEEFSKKAKKSFEVIGEEAKKTADTINKSFESINKKTEELALKSKEHQKQVKEIVKSQKTQSTESSKTKKEIDNLKKKITELTKANQDLKKSQTESTKSFEKTKSNLKEITKEAKTSATDLKSAFKQAFGDGSKGTISEFFKKEFSSIKEIIGSMKLDKSQIDMSGSMKGVVEAIKEEMGNIKTEGITLKLGENIAADLAKSLKKAFYGTKSNTRTTLATFFETQFKEINKTIKAAFSSGGGGGTGGGGIVVPDIGAEVLVGMLKNLENEKASSSGNLTKALLGYFNLELSNLSEDMQAQVKAFAAKHGIVLGEEFTELVKAIKKHLADQSDIRLIKDVSGFGSPFDKKGIVRDAKEIQKVMSQHNRELASLNKKYSETFKEEWGSIEKRMQSFSKNRKTAEATVSEVMSGTNVSSNMKSLKQMAMATSAEYTVITNKIETLKKEAKRASNAIMAEVGSEKITDTIKQKRMKEEADLTKKILKEVRQRQREINKLTVGYAKPGVDALGKTPFKGMVKTDEEFTIVAKADTIKDKMKDLTKTNFETTEEMENAYKNYVKEYESLTNKLTTLVQERIDKTNAYSLEEKEMKKAYVEKLKMQEKFNDDFIKKEKEQQNIIRKLKGDFTEEEVLKSSKKTLSMTMDKTIASEVEKMKKIEEMMKKSSEYRSKSMSGDKDNVYKNLALEAQKYTEKEIAILKESVAKRKNAELAELERYKKIQEDKKRAFNSVMDFAKRAKKDAQAQDEREMATIKNQNVIEREEAKRTAKYKIDMENRKKKAIEAAVEFAKRAKRDAQEQDEREIAIIKNQNAIEREEAKKTAKYRIDLENRKKRALQDVMKYTGFTSQGTDMIASFKQFGHSIRRFGHDSAVVLKSVNRRFLYLTATITAFTAATAYGLKRSVEGLISFAKSISRTTEEIRGYNIALYGMMKTHQGVDEMMEMALKTTKRMPIGFKTVQESLKGLVLIGPVRDMLRDAEDMEGVMQRLFKIVVGLSQIQPEWGAKGAIFSLRNALTGDLRSLQRRFELPVRNIYSKEGVALQDLQYQPEKMVETLESYIGTFYSEETLEMQNKQISAIFDKISGNWIRFLSKIGESGFYDVFAEDFLKVRDLIEDFVGSKSIDKYAKRISDSFANMYESIKNVATMFGGGVLKSLGFGGEGAADAAALVFENIAKFARVAEKTITSIDYKKIIAEIGTAIEKEVMPYIKQGWEILKGMQSDLKWVYGGLKKVGEGFKKMIKEVTGKEFGSDASSRGLIWMALFGVGNVFQITGSLSLMAMSMVSIFTSTFKTLSALVAYFKLTWLGAWMAPFAQVAVKIAAVYGAIKLLGSREALSGLVDGFTGLVKGFAEGMAVVTLDMEKSFKSLVGKIGEWFYQSFSSVFELIGKKAALEGGAWSTLAKTMGIAEVEVAPNEALLKQINEKHGQYLETRSDLENPYVVAKSETDLRRIFTSAEQNLLRQRNKLIDKYEEDYGELETKYFGFKKTYVPKEVTTKDTFDDNLGYIKESSINTFKELGTMAESAFMKAYGSVVTVTSKAIEGSGAVEPIKNKVTEFYNDFLSELGLQSSETKDSVDKLSDSLEYLKNNIANGMDPELKGLKNETVIGGKYVMEKLNSLGLETKLTSAVRGEGVHSTGKAIDIQATDWSKTDRNQISAVVKAMIDAGIISKAIFEDSIGIKGRGVFENMDIVKNESKMHHMYMPEKDLKGSLLHLEFAPSKGEVNEYASKLHEMDGMVNHVIDFWSNLKNNMDNVDLTSYENTKKVTDELSKNILRDMAYVRNSLEEVHEGFKSHLRKSTDVISSAFEEYKEESGHTFGPDRVEQLTVRLKNLKKSRQSALKKLNEESGGNTENLESLLFLRTLGEGLQGNFGYSTKSIAATMRKNGLDLQGIVSFEPVKKIANAMKQATAISTEFDKNVKETNETIGAIASKSSEILIDKEVIKGFEILNINAEKYMETMTRKYNFDLQVEAARAASMEFSDILMKNKQYEKVLTSVIALQQLENKSLEEAVEIVKDKLENSTLDGEVVERITDEFKNQILYIEKHRSAVARLRFEYENIENSISAMEMSELSENFDKFISSPSKKVRSALGSRYGGLLEEGLEVEDGDSIFSKGIRIAVAEFEQFHDIVYSSSKTLVGDLSKTFEDDFFGFLTGKLTRLGDMFKNIGDVIGSTIARIIAQMAAMSMTRFVLGIDINNKTTGGGLVGALAGGGSSSGGLIGAIGNLFGSGGDKSSSGGGFFTEAFKQLHSSTKTNPMGEILKGGVSSSITKGSGITNAFKSVGTWIKNNPLTTAGVLGAATFLTQPGRVFGGTRDKTGAAQDSMESYNDRRSAMVDRRFDDSLGYYMGRDNSNFDFANIGYSTWTSGDGWFKGPKEKHAATDPSAWLKDMEVYYDLLLKSGKEHYTQMRKIHKESEVNQLKSLQMQYSFDVKKLTMIQQEYDRYSNAAYTAEDKFEKMDEYRNQLLEQEFSNWQMQEELNKIIKETTYKDMEYRAYLSSQTDDLMAMTRANIEIEKSRLSQYKQGTMEWYDSKMNLMQMEKDLANNLREIGKQSQKQIEESLKVVYGFSSLSERQKLTKGVYYQRDIDLLERAQIGAATEQDKYKMGMEITGTKKTPDYERYNREMAAYQAALLQIAIVPDGMRANVRAPNKPSLKYITEDIYSKPLEQAIEDYKELIEQNLKIDTLTDEKNILKEKTKRLLSNTSESVFEAFYNLLDYKNLITTSPLIEEGTKKEAMAEIGVEVESFYNSLAQNINDVLKTGFITTNMRSVSFFKLYMDMGTKFSEELEKQYESIMLQYRRSVGKDNILNTIKDMDDFSIYNEVMDDSLMKNYKNVLGASNISSAGFEDPYEMWYNFNKKTILQRIANSEENSDEWFSAQNDLFQLMTENAIKMKEKAEDMNRSIEDMLGKIEETMRMRVAEERESAKGDIMFVDVGAHRDSSAMLDRMLAAIKTNDPNARKLIDEFRKKMIGIAK